MSSGQSLAAPCLSADPQYDGRVCKSQPSREQQEEGGILCEVGIGHLAQNDGICIQLSDAKSVLSVRFRGTDCMHNMII